MVSIIALDVGDDNIEVSATDLIFRNVTASGSLTGLPYGRCDAEVQRSHARSGDGGAARLHSGKGRRSRAGNRRVLTMSVAPR
jgi:hypothetical protein